MKLSKDKAVVTCGKCDGGVLRPSTFNQDGVEHDCMLCTSCGWWG